MHLVWLIDKNISLSLHYLGLSDSKIENIDFGFDKKSAACGYPHLFFQKVT